MLYFHRSSVFRTHNGRDGDGNDMIDPKRGSIAKPVSLIEQARTCISLEPLREWEILEYIMGKCKDRMRVSTFSVGWISVS